MNDAVANNVGLPVGHELLWYEIQSVLGHGGFGITYLAHDNNLGRDVALKEFMPRMWASRQSDFTVRPFASEHHDSYKKGLSSFMLEARTLAKFKHPNIVQVQTVFEHHGTAYMVMEYEQGESLSNLLKASRFDATQTRLEKLLFPIIDGLQNVHDGGFLHRDIKPSNIYLRMDESPVLIDFGSSRQTELLNTSDATVLVSQGYTPLEQYNKGFGDQGPWTDIYALAASVYYSLSGRVVADSMHRNASIQTGEPDPLVSFSEIAGGSPFSREFVGAIDRALELDPRERPQSLSQWQGMFQHQSDKTVLIGRHKPPVYANTQAKTRIQKSDEPWMQAPERSAPEETRATESRVVPPSMLHRNRSLPKSIYLAAVAGLAVVVAAGGYLWVQKRTAPMDITSEIEGEIAGISIETLPRPEMAIDVVAPVDRLHNEILLLDRQWELYSKAREIDGNSPEALSGVSSVVARYELLAKSSAVRNNKQLSNAVAESMVRSVGVNASNQALIAKLVAGNSNRSLDKLLTLFDSSSLSVDERGDLLFGIAELSVQDKNILLSNPKYMALIQNFKKAIVTQVQAGEYSLAAVMVELALLVQPSDSELIQLQQQLSR